MDVFNIGWHLFTPTNGITLSVSHLSLSGTFLFYFSGYILFPARSNNIYHTLYDILFEIRRHKQFNQCFLFFGFVDNTFINVLMLQTIIFLFFVIVCVLHGFHILYIIIPISTWCIIFISTWSICIFRIIIICLVS